MQLLQPLNFLLINVLFTLICVRSIGTASYTNAERMYLLCTFYRINCTDFTLRGDHSHLTLSRVKTEVFDNVVYLSIYMEAQCPDTSRFIHQQLLPTWLELSVTNRISIKIVPFGKAKCVPYGRDYSCQCQHGPAECELNQLMNCIIDIVRDPRQYVPVISCIQGKLDLRSAAIKCLSKIPQSNKNILRCAEGEEGRRLLAKAGAETESLQPPMNFVPWILINGRRSIDAFYDLKKNLCDELSPVPWQCRMQQ